MQRVHVHYTDRGELRSLCLMHFNPKCKSERSNALDAAADYLHLGYKVSFKPL